MGTATWVRSLGIAAGLAVLAWFLYLTREALPPFVIALVFAVILDPVLDGLQRRGWSRRAAAAAVFAVFLLVFLLVAFVLLPMAVHQAVELVRNVPGYYARLTAWSEQLLSERRGLLERLHLPTSSTQILSQYQQQISGFLSTLVSRLVAALGGSLGKLVWLVIIPIVTFYLLQDLDAIGRRLRSLLPEGRRNQVTHMARGVVAVFAGYVRGLCIVCAALGVVDSLLLTFVFHLPYALVIGIFAGILYAVPYVGPAASSALGALVALSSPHASAGYVLAVAATMLIAMLVFDQGITPRVLGKLVGLHPVVSLFALTVGGTVAGVAGMILAVPVAASIKVVLVELFPALTRPLPEEAGPVPLAMGDAQPGADPDRATAPAAPPVTAAVPPNDGG